MRTHTPDEARAEFPDLVERALAGDPRRVVRDRKKAVVIVSEADWARRAQNAAPPASDTTLAGLFLKHAGEKEHDVAELADDETPRLPAGIEPVAIEHPDLDDVEKELLGGVDEVFEPEANGGEVGMPGGTVHREIKLP